MCSQANADRQTDRWVSGTRVTDWEHMYNGWRNQRQYVSYMFAFRSGFFFSPHFRVQKFTDKDETRTVKVPSLVFFPILARLNDSQQWAWVAYCGLDSATPFSLYATQDKKRKVPPPHHLGTHQHACCQAVSARRPSLPPQSVFLGE